VSVAVVADACRSFRRLRCRSFPEQDFVTDTHFGGGQGRRDLIVQRTSAALSQSTVLEVFQRVAGFLASPVRT
jgi:hypothetical protein